jgi:hypothetical protein
MKDLFGSIDHHQAVQIVLNYLESHHIKHQRVAGYTDQGKVFVVIDGVKINSSWGKLTMKAKQYNFDIVVHSQAFETTE